VETGLPSKRCSRRMATFSWTLYGFRGFRDIGFSLCYANSSTEKLRVEERLNTFAQPRNGLVGLPAAARIRLGFVPSVAISHVTSSTLVIRSTAASSCNRERRAGRRMQSTIGWECEERQGDGTAMENPRFTEGCCESIQQPVCRYTRRRARRCPCILPRRSIRHRPSQRGTLPAKKDRFPWIVDGRSRHGSSREDGGT